MMVSNAPPSILMPTPLLPHDVTYTSPDEPISINLVLSDMPTILGVGLSPTDTLPDGVLVVGPVMREPTMAEARIQWQPTSKQLGTHIMCFVATDNSQAKSPPTCLVVIVTNGFEEVRENDLGKQGFFFWGGGGGGELQSLTVSRIPHGSIYLHYLRSHLPSTTINNMLLLGWGKSSIFGGKLSTLRGKFPGKTLIIGCVYLTATIGEFG